jgi:hypothetical protein
LAHALVIESKTRCHNRALDIVGHVRTLFPYA